MRRIHRNSYAIQSKIQRMCAVFKNFSARGWCDATSTNISVRHGSEVVISKSGGAKEAYGPADFLRMPLLAPRQLTDWLNTAEGGALSKSLGRPSAETPLHLAIYQKHASAGAVIHTHSMACTLLSELAPASRQLSLPALEMAKGVRGVHDHLSPLKLPVFANSQDMVALAELYSSYQSRASIEYGLILRGHGLYAFGKDLAEAKRHVETYEYLLNYMLSLKSALG